MWTSSDPQLVPVQQNIQQDAKINIRKIVFLGMDKMNESNAFTIVTTEISKYCYNKIIGSNNNLIDS